MNPCELALMISSFCLLVAITTLPMESRRGKVESMDPFIYCVSLILISLQTPVHFLIQPTENPIKHHCFVNYLWQLWKVPDWVCPVNCPFLSQLLDKLVSDQQRDPLF